MFQQTFVTIIPVFLIPIFLIPVFLIPVFFTVVISRLEVILSDSIIAHKVFDPSIFGIKHSLDLTAPNILHAKVVNQNKCFKH